MIKESLIKEIKVEINKYYLLELQYEATIFLDIQRARAKWLKEHKQQRFLERQAHHNLG